jgi:hypothetical protein
MEEEETEAPPPHFEAMIEKFRELIAASSPDTKGKYTQEKIMHMFNETISHGLSHFNTEQKTRTQMQTETNKTLKKMETLYDKFEKSMATPAPSFAQVAQRLPLLPTPEAPQKQHTLTVTYNSEITTQEQFEKAKQEIGGKITKAGVRPKQIRRSRKGNIVIDLHTHQDKTRTKENLSDYKIHDEDTREIALHIRGLTTNNKEETEEQLKKENTELSDCKFIWLERKNRNTQQQHHIPKLIIPKNKAASLLKNNRIYNSQQYKTHTLELWTLTPHICHNCLEDNHSKQHCKNKTKCRNCGTDHEEGNCDGHLFCTWCKKDGHAASPQCPTFMKKKEEMNTQLQQEILQLSLC